MPSLFNIKKGFTSLIRENGRWWLPVWVFWRYRVTKGWFTNTIDPGFQPHQCLFANMWMRTARQVLHQRWIWVFFCTQATKHASKEIHPGFETHGRCYQRSKNRGISRPLKKRLMSCKFFFLKKDGVPIML